MNEKFGLGHVVITRNAMDTLVPASVHAALRRHHTGDWGELDAHDREVNEEALREELRLFSAYSDSKGTKFWIITEADRSVTTILLPEDY